MKGGRFLGLHCVHLDAGAGLPDHMFSSIPRPTTGLRPHRLGPYSVSNLSLNSSELRESPVQSTSGHPSGREENGGRVYTALHPPSSSHGKSHIPYTLQ